MASYENILEYWFGQLAGPLDFPVEKSALWFRKSADTDQEIRSRYQLMWQHALGGLYDSWKATPHGRLALIILLDQFSRNMYRGQARAFKGDAKALVLAQDGVKSKFDRSLFPIERVFLYLPFEHSEDLAMQEQSVALFSNLADTVPEQLKRPMSEFLRYAKAHQEIIKQFGRFPHRNAILNRASTPEEIEFLKKPGSSF